MKLSIFVFAAVLVGVTVLGCSKNPPVEKELVQPVSTAPASTDGAGMVGSSHQEEADVAAAKMGAATQAAGSSEPPPLEAKEGFTVVSAPSRMGTMHFLSPEGWKQTEPASSMRILQLSAPPVEGDTEPGEFAFFSPIGGSIDDNINRWAGQFSQPDGSDSASKLKKETFQGTQYSTTLVELVGKMEAQAMPGMPAQPEREGWMMLAAILESPSGLWFIKGTGPEKTMTAARDAFIEMAKSVHVTGGAAGAHSF